MTASLSPREKVSNVLTYWWVIVTAAIIGGLIGLTVSTVKKPVYEARATFTISLDFARTGILTQYDKDLALGTAASAIFSYNVMQQVADAAQQNGIATDFETLKHTAVMERKAAQWTLRVRASDPEDAAFLVNQWVDFGLADLNVSYQHALMAENLQNYIQTLETCMQQVSVNAVVPLCPYPTLAELETELKAASDALFVEKQASRNLFPGITYSLDQYATPPAEPALYGRNTLVLAGLILGLILGVGIVSTTLPNRLFEKK